MKVTKHDPQPTYDIVGLTPDEFTLIRYLVGRSIRDDEDKAKVPFGTNLLLYKELDKHILLR